MYFWPKMCSLHPADRFHIVCVFGRLIDLEKVQKNCVQPPKSWSGLQALNKGVIEVQLLEVGVKVCR